MPHHNTRALGLATRRDEGLAGAFSAFLDRVRSGDLGMLPVVVGLIVISVVFSALNPVFLAPNNLANLLFDASAVGLISLGVVLVLLLGEIDLSIGSMSGLSSALIGVQWVKYGVPLPLAILGAVAGGAAVGLVFALPLGGGGLREVLLHEAQPVAPARVKLAVEALDDEHFLRLEPRDLARCDGQPERGDETRAQPLVLHRGAHVGLAIADEAER